MSGERKEGRTRAEWTTLALSALMVAALVGVLVYASVSGDEGPPAFAIRTDAPVVRAGGEVYVPVRVENVGGETAEEVTIEVRAPSIGETAQLSFQFVAPGEVVEGLAPFRRPPDDVEANVVGVTRP